MAPAKAPAACAPPEVGCFSEVFGQTRAKRGLEIAAAGGHNMLMIGPPGSGKTMLARRLASLLPALSAEHAIEVTRVHSAAGPNPLRGLIQHPPFRSPHHTASEPALCGGGTVPRPGEITLAHRGILFLDELPEFSRRALESLREPLEEGCIHIARSSMSLRFPADVLLLAAMNPCPCGYAEFGGAEASVAPRPPKASAQRRRMCLCPFDRIQRYRSRISGPLLDRIDLHVAVQPVAYRDFARRGSGETSAAMKDRVALARRAQQERLGDGMLNARMTQAQIARHVPLQEISLCDLEQATDAHLLSTRAISRILKVARTIADLDESHLVSPEHIREAVGFRLLDGQPDPRATPLHGPGSDAVAV